MQRIDKENYYLDIADAVLRRSTCMRRKYGAIIVKNDEILSTGYKPAPLAEKAKHVHVIGDACKVGNLRTVIWQAWDVAMKI